MDRVSVSAKRYRLTINPQKFARVFFVGTIFLLIARKTQFIITKQVQADAERTAKTRIRAGAS